MARKAQEKNEELPPRITVSDHDTMNTVITYKRRKGYKSNAEALDKLVAKAAHMGLHLQDAVTA